MPGVERMVHVAVDYWLWVEVKATRRPRRYF